MKEEGGGGGKGEGEEEEEEEKQRMRRAHFFIFRDLVLTGLPSSDSLPREMWS